jgi:hypothetical protein
MNYLTPKQVFILNEKHGWFMYGDAQSNVSQSFAQDVIEMHERTKAAAPALLAALQDLVHSLDEADLLHDDQRKAFAAAVQVLEQATKGVT